MKKPLVMFSGLIACISPITANPASKSTPALSKSAAKAPSYRSESPLPQGWPEPGPFDQVARKAYPAYRAAVTPTSRENGGFWTLFKHIKREGIPMTAPVEMKVDADKGMEMEEMLFLYQSPEVGKAGTDAEGVEVRDVPAVEVLAYAWQGGRSKAATNLARSAIDAELKRLNLKAASYRLFGYNSPAMPNSKKTHELQAVLMP